MGGAFAVRTVGRAAGLSGCVVDGAGAVEAGSSAPALAAGGSEGNAEAGLSEESGGCASLADLSAREASAAPLAGEEFRPTM